MLLILSVQGSTYSNCTDGDIRLLNGSTKYEGRVEICINNAWGTITHWDSNTAQTVCNQLGYTGSGKYETVKYNQIEPGSLVLRYQIRKIVL